MYTYLCLEYLTDCTGHIAHQHASGGLHLSSGTFARLFYFILDQLVRVAKLYLCRSV